jgi:fructose-1,6-bisphosphatase-3
MYLAEHQQFDIETIGKKNADMISRTIKIEQFPDRLRVRDTDGGKDVEERIADLQQLLAAYRSGIIRTPDRMG